MKKFVAIILAVVLCLSVCACGAKEDSVPVIGICQ